MTAESDPRAVHPADPEPHGGRARLDVALVRRGLARSRGQAHELIVDGAVRVNDTVASKPAQRVGPDDRLSLTEQPGPWVGRAAHKLLAALDQFGPAGLQVEGRRCLDVGASTGGFTQVLLTRGARAVVALDVGHGQLAAPVASDPRVDERSGTNVRDVVADDLGGPFDLVVCDLSFISVRTVLGRLAEFTAPDGDLVVLVKPQFEVGRGRLGKGGVVRAAADRRSALLDVLSAAATHALVPHGLGRSPIAGSSGNREYLLWLARSQAGMMIEQDVTQLAETLTREEDSA